MKKNFFKKLSFVLALAMIISVIAPAAGAFAAAKPVLNSTKQYLYLSELSGKTEYDFNIKNKLAGWKYAWTSSNKAAATVDAKNGFTTAVGVGSTKVTLKITDSKKKAVATLSADVIVRDNIQSVTVSNAPEKALTVGASFDFNRSFVTASGSTTKTTAITRWVVDKTTATITDSGLFTATAADTYKVQAVAFQSKAKYETWKAQTTKDDSLVLATSPEVSVTVAATMTVAQTDLKNIKLTFDSPMTDVAKNLSIYTVVGTTEVLVTTAKPVVVSTDKKSATVEFYVPLTEGATYVVKYTGVESAKFTAATSAVDKVASVVVKTTEGVVNVSTPVDFQLLDVNGVNISTTTLKSRVTMTSSSNRVFFDSAAKSVVFFTKGDTTQIEATYHTYKYESGKEVGNIVGSGTVVGVDAASTVVGAVKAWTMIAATTSPSFSDLKQTLAVGETKNLYVQLNTATGSTTSTVDNGAGMGKFTFASSDSTILFIDNLGTLYPIKAGTVTVVVKYDGTPVDVITISVGAARTATSLVLGNTEVSLSSSNAVQDTKTVSVKVKDQYGDDLVGFVSGDIAITKLDGSPSTLIGSVSGTDVVFKGSDGTTPAVNGTYYYKVSAKGLVAYVTVTVVNPTSTTAASYQLALSATEVDSKSTTDVVRPTMTIDLFGYAGVKTSHPGVTGAYAVYVTNPDNVTTQITSTTYDLTTVSGSALTPIKSGTYTVTAKNASGVAVDVKYFTVKNTQAEPTFEVKLGAYTSASTTLNAIATECFKVSFNGAEVSGFTMGSDAIGTVGTKVFVKTLKWTETIGAYTLEHTINVNTLIEMQ